MERRTDKRETPQKSLTKNETDALKDLSSRCDIIIFKVDKIVDRKKKLQILTTISVKQTNNRTIKYPIKKVQMT